MANIKEAFLANLIHSPSYGNIEHIAKALVEVNDNGIITGITTLENPNYEKKVEFYKKNNNLTVFDNDKFLLPGFIDLHIHAPQWPQAGLALDDELSVWLNKYTFPLEAKYKDIEFARKVYTNLVETLLSLGTTSAMYFATIHNESSLELAKICGELGQRGFVGKVVMDDKNTNPNFYRDNSTKEALENSEKFILDVKDLSKKYSQGVYPVITPRFVPSCTDEVLAGLGKLAKKYNAYVQSHCSESDWEHNYVYNRFNKRDSEVLKDFNLLGRKSIMAHCNFIDENDGEIFKNTASSVCHCPISNCYFANAALPVNKLKKQGVNICLGSDISGGFSPSLYDNIRQTVMVSRVLNDGVDNNLSSEKRGVKNSKVSIFESFYLATTAGGIALNLPLGLFKEGYICDFQVIDTKDLSIFDNLDAKHILQKILYLGTKNNIKEVWVQGKLVHKKE